MYKIIWYIDWKMGCWPFKGNNQFHSSQVRSSFVLMI